MSSTAIALLWLLLFAAPSQPAAHGNFCGVVQDQTGAEIGNAALELTTEGIRVSAQSDASGQFCFNRVEPDDYQLTLALAVSAPFVAAKSGRLTRLGRHGARRNACPRNLKGNCTKQPCSLRSRRCHRSTSDPHTHRCRAMRHVHLFCRPLPGQRRIQSADIGSPLVVRACGRLGK